MAQLTIQLSPQEIEIVLQALGKQPFELVANLWFKIRTQRDDALKAGDAEPAAPDAQKGD